MRCIPWDSGPLAASMQILLSLRESANLPQEEAYEINREEVKDMITLVKYIHHGDKKHMNEAVESIKK